MPLCLIVENPDQTGEQIKQVMEHLRNTGPVPPEGAHLLIGGLAQHGSRFVSVWDSQEALERFFADRLSAAYRDVGLTFDNVTRTLVDVHTLLLAPSAATLVADPAPAR